MRAPFSLSLVPLLCVVACDDTNFISTCPEDELVVEIGTVTLGDDGVHEQGEQCVVVDQDDGSIDYTGCCPEGWEYLSLGGEGGILCQWVEETTPTVSCPTVVEVALYSDPDGVTLPAGDCTIAGKDGSTDYTSCCPDGYFVLALGPDIDTVLCST